MKDRPHFRSIDESNIGDHARLSADDQCLYMFEYTSNKNYTFSKPNAIISNLKKKPSLANEWQYHYKRQAIRYCGSIFESALNPKWLAQAVLVPIPPSKQKTHPEYDDRISQICQRISNATVREIIVQNTSMDAAHESGNPRPTIQELIDVYDIDELQCNPEPSNIGIVDDVLTAGTHFKAAQTVLQNRFPEAKIVGIFIARRVFPEIELEFEAIEI